MVFAYNQNGEIIALEIRLFEGVMLWVKIKNCESVGVHGNIVTVSAIFAPQTLK